MKKIAILGSTGSIGTQTLSVIEEHADDFEVTALACGNNIRLLEEQMRAAPLRPARWVFRPLRPQRRAHSYIHAGRPRRLRRAPT